MNINKEWVDKNFTVDAILQWIDKQPEEREFNYLDNKNCFFASFLKEWLGLKDGELSVSGFDFGYLNKRFCFNEEIRKFQRGVLLSLGGGSNLQLKK